MANDPYPLIYEGILDNAHGRPLAGFSRQDGQVWLFNRPSLEARLTNRRAQKLPTEAEEAGLRDLLKALEGQH